MNQRDEQLPHRLFAAIVLIGTGLTVGCGGIAQPEREAGGGSSAGAHDTGSGGSGSGVGGALQTPLGVAGGEPGSSEPGPWACPPQQWACRATECDSSDRGLRLPEAEACGCDATRPLSAEDCEPGQLFVCQEVTSTSDGRRFTEPVALSCSCAPKSDGACQSACANPSPGLYPSCEFSEDELSVLCGCAIAYLK